MEINDELLDDIDLSDEDGGTSSFERRPISNDQLFRQIRVRLLMNVHNVTKDVAVMMMKANDMPKRRGE